MCNVKLTHLYVTQYCGEERFCLNDKKSHLLDNITDGCGEHGETLRHLQSNSLVSIPSDSPDCLNFEEISNNTIQYNTN